MHDASPSAYRYLPFRKRQQPHSVIILLLLLSLSVSLLLFLFSSFSSAPSHSSRSSSSSTSSSSSPHSSSSAPSTFSPSSSSSSPSSFRASTYSTGEVHNPVVLQHEHSNEEQELDDAIFGLATKNLINGKYLILAIANFGNLEFTLNWIESLRRTNHDRYLVMCLDAALCARLDPDHSALVPTHWLQKEIDPSPLLYGTSEYVNLVQSKTLVVVPFFRMGFTIMFSDVDIVWLSDRIVPYFEWLMKDNKYLEMAFSVDQTPEPVPSINSGFWFAKPTENVIRVFDRTVTLQIKRNATQQSAMNVVLSQFQLKTSPHIHFLDKMLFPNGHLTFRSKIQPTMRISPLIVHANYLKGAKMKKKRLQMAGYWYLDDAAMQSTDTPNFASSDPSLLPPSISDTEIPQDEEFSDADLDDGESHEISNSAHAGRVSSIFSAVESSPLKPGQSASCSGCRRKWKGSKKKPASRAPL